MKLGQLLIKKGKLGDDQLRVVLAKQREEPAAPLGELLVRMGLVSKHDVLDALCTQPSFVYDAIDFSQVEKTVAQLIPRQAAESLDCLAVARDGDRLTIAMADPLDFGALRQLRSITGGEVRAVFADSQDLGAAIEQLYGDAPRRFLPARRRRRSDGYPSAGIDEPPGATTASSPAPDDGDAEAGSRDSDPTTGAKKVHGEDVPVHDVGNRLQRSTSKTPASSPESPPISTNRAARISGSVDLQNLLLEDALRAKASDIHIEPRLDHLLVRNRVDGRLTPGQILPKWMHPGLLSRFKVMANMDIAEKRLPQDGRCRVQVLGRQVDLRLSTLPTRHGEKMVVRLLDRNNQILDLDDLGAEPEQLGLLKDLISYPQGMILVVGPTGAGKTTTLYSLLQKIDSEELNVVTIEDPIEYELPTINQVQVREQIDLTFSRVLRSVLRQDPDVILVGEIRDSETAEIAVRASLTGHLLLSTLHTNSAVLTLVRLLDLGVSPYLVGSSLLGVVSQRLVRRVCPDCSVPDSPSNFVLGILGIQGKPDIGFRHGAGCPACNDRGYRGRVALFETLKMTGALRQAILRGAGEAEILKAARQSGFYSIRESGLSKLRAGVTSAEEVARVVRDVEDGVSCRECGTVVPVGATSCSSCGAPLTTSCQRCGHSVSTEWDQCPQCSRPLSEGRRSTIPLPYPDSSSQPRPILQRLRAVNPTGGD